MFINEHVIFAVLNRSGSSGCLARKSLVHNFVHRLTNWNIIVRLYFPISRIKIWKWSQCSHLIPSKNINTLSTKQSFFSTCLVIGWWCCDFMYIFYMHACTCYTQIDRRANQHRHTHILMAKDVFDLVPSHTRSLYVFPKAGKS